MTPTDEAAKLAEQLAEALCGPLPYPFNPNPVTDPTKRFANNRWEDEIARTIHRITPILTAHLAARDEELKRLREAAAWKPSAADHIVTPMLAGWVVSLWCDGGKDWHGKAVWNHDHAADSVVKTEGDCLAQCMTRLASHIERHCRRQEFVALQPKEPKEAGE